MLLLSFESNLPPPPARLHRGRPLYFRGLNLHLGSTRVGGGDGDPHRFLPPHDSDRGQSAADDDEPLTPESPVVIVAAAAGEHEEAKESHSLPSSAGQNTGGLKAAGMQTSNCKDFTSA